jgi:glycosyltransferase involved in cell wall biosynthesis
MFGQKLNHSLVGSPIDRRRVGVDFVGPILEGAFHLASPGADANFNVDSHLNQLGKSSPCVNSPDKVLYIGSMRKRILILCDKSPKTSFGRIALSILRATQAEHDAEMVWLSCKKDFPDPLNLAGHSAWSPTRELGRMMFPWQLARILKKVRPDWVLLIRPELGFLLPAIRKAAPNAKTTLMIHDTFAETLYPDSLKFKLINRFWIHGADRVDGFLFNSHWTQAQAKTAFQIHGPQTVCGCEIDPADFHPLCTTPEALKQKWQLDPGRKAVLQISLDEPRKNIRIFLLLAQKFPHVQFIRIGVQSKWINEFIAERQIQNLQHRHGLSLESLREFYNLADALVFPSYLEGFGYPPLEALGCGTPVIASNTSAMKETLPGVASLIDDPDDLDSWVVALESLLSQGKLLSTLTPERLDYFGPASFAGRIQKHLNDLLPD